MSLSFGAVNTDRVVLATSTLLDVGNPFTVAGWFYPTTLTSGRILFAKAGGLYVVDLSGTGGDLRLQWNRAGGSTSFITNDTPLANLNQWYFVAGVMDTTASAGNVGSIYTGTLTTAVVESTYGTATDGAGGVGTNGLAWAIGNRGAGTQNLSFEGRIAWAGLWTRALTLANLRELQYRMMNTVDCQVFMHLGHQGTGTQIDYSGNKINGTVTGATVAAHVLLSSPWGWDTPPPPKNRFDNPRLLRLQPGFGRVVRTRSPGLVKARL